MTVAEELHFGKAADRLYLGQPAVSEAIRRLEGELGGSLFNRSSRRVSLTQLGERFLPEARAALLQVRRAYDVGRALAQEAEEVLAVGYAEAVGHDLLLRSLTRLRTEFPGTVAMPRRLDTSVQLEALERGTLDIGIGWGPVRSAAVTTKRLSTERFVALLPEGHALAECPLLRPESLSGQAILTWPHQVNSGLCDRLIKAFDVAGATLRIVRTADDVHGISTHIAAGAGIGMAVASAVADHKLPGIRAVPLTGRSTTVNRILLLPKPASRPDQLRLAGLLLTALTTTPTAISA